MTWSMEMMVCLRASEKTRRYSCVGRRGLGQRLSASGINAGKSNVRQSRVGNELTEMRHAAWLWGKIRGRDSTGEGERVLGLDISNCT